MSCCGERGLIYSRVDVLDVGVEFRVERISTLWWRLMIRGSIRTEAGGDVSPTECGRYTVVPHGF